VAVREPAGERLAEHVGELLGDDRDRHRERAVAEAAHAGHPGVDRDPGSDQRHRHRVLRPEAGQRQDAPVDRQVGKREAAHPRVVRFEHEVGRAPRERQEDDDDREDGREAGGVVQRPGGQRADDRRQEPGGVRPADPGRPRACSGQLPHEREAHQAPAGDGDAPEARIATNEALESTIGNGA